MEDILKDISQVKGILGSLIISRDGLIIAQDFSATEEVDLLAADLAELTNLSVQLIQEKLNQGNFDTLSIEAAKGRISVKAINENTFLIVMANLTINLGLLFWELKSKAEKLRQVL